MAEIANFKKQQFGADVATILETADQVLEVVRRDDGTFNLIVHNRRGETDTWDDLSVNLKPQHFSVLGSIASMGHQRNSHVAEPLRSIVNSFSTAR